MKSSQAPIEKFKIKYIIFLMIRHGTKIKHNSDDHFHYKMKIKENIAMYESFYNKEKSLFIKQLYLNSEIIFETEYHNKHLDFDYMKNNNIFNKIKLSQLYVLLKS